MYTLPQLRAIALPLATVIAVLLACDDDRNGGGGNGGGVGGTVQACQDVTLPLSLTNTQAAGASLICTYETDVAGYDNCTLTRTTVAGSPPTPTSVTVERSNSDADATRSPSTNPGWTAMTTGLNCNTPLGCLNGDYEVELVYSGIDARPTNIELELEIP